MIKNISLPELHSSNYLTEVCDKETISIRKEPWTIKKGLGKNMHFEVVSSRRVFQKQFQPDLSKKSLFNAYPYPSQINEFLNNLFKWILQL